MVDSARLESSQQLGARNRSNSNNLVDDGVMGKGLRFGEELILVGCSCQKDFCQSSPFPHFMRGRVQPDGPLRAGDSKPAPLPEDCPGGGSQVSEPGAEPSVDVPMGIEAGTGATVRVRLVKAASLMKQGVDFHGNTRRVREGHMVYVFPADAPVEDFSDVRKSLNPDGAWIEKPFRRPFKRQVKGDEADNEEVFHTGEIIELSTPLLTGYGCEILAVTEAMKAKCWHYARLIDVFQFRAIRPSSSGGYLVWTTDQICNAVVPGAVKRDTAALQAFSIAKHKTCKCPEGKVISGNLDCERRSKTDARKFDPEEFNALGCSCTDGKVSSAKLDASAPQSQSDVIAPEMDNTMM